MSLSTEDPLNARSKNNIGNPDTDKGHWVTLDNGKHIFIKDEKGGNSSSSSGSSSHNTNSSSNTSKNTNTNLNKNSNANSENKKRTEEYISRKQKEPDEDNKRRIKNNEVNKKSTGETGGAANVNNNPQNEKLFPVTNMINRYKENNDPNNVGHIVKTILTSEANTTFSDKTLKQAREFIQGSEGFRAEAYKNKGDVWTIGYGHTKGVKPGDKITKEEAERLYREDFKEHSDALKAVKVPLTENQKVALASFAYNMGPTGFRNSDAVKILNTGDYKGAADELLNYNRQNGIVLDGLTNRRKKERELFLK